MLILIKKNRNASTKMTISLNPFSLHDIHTSNEAELI